MPRIKPARKVEKRDKLVPSLAPVPHREPTGRRSRRKADTNHEANVTAVAISARQKHTQLPMDLLTLSDGGRANAGTMHGVMRLRGIMAEEAGKALPMDAITDAQFQAAETYLKRRESYRRSIQARNTDDAPGYSATDAPDFMAPGYDWTKDPYAVWVKETAAKWSAVLSALERSGPGCFMAVDHLADLKPVPPHWLGWVKRGLDGIAVMVLGLEVVA